MKSSWYRKISDNTENLHQGDLVFGLKLPSLEIGDVSSKAAIEKSVDLNWDTENYIILTQSCDLEPENDKAITTVLVAPVYSLDDFLRVNTNFATQSKVKSILENKVVGIFPLESPTDRAEPIVVSEYHALFVQLDALTSLVQNSRTKLDRYRLQSPYVEALANDYASIFSRPALPTKFPHDDVLLRGRELANAYNPSIRK